MQPLAIRNNPLITRSDFQLAFHQLCDPLIPYYSPGKAHLKLGATGSGCTNETAEMEGFSRVLWGLVPLAAGGGDTALWELYREGIRNGTNPEHEEYWGAVNDYDQKLVEMAAMGLALGMVPEQVWDPLTEAEKVRFFEWLNQMNGKSLHDCNWLFFLVMVNLGFKKLGLPYDREQMDRNLDRIDEFYLSDGWYADGIGAHCDYYGPFAIHYYGLIYSAWMAEDDPERAARYRQRAIAFAKEFIYWFAGDGSALPYGRSLTYRFSQAAFWSAMAYAGVEAFPYGVMKGLILRHLRWWFRQPIFHPDGTLTIGYAYPNLVMAENYNAPGSPYWALKTFLVLALPEEHPFWQAEELPLPELNRSAVQQPPHLVVLRQETLNHVLAFNTGHASTNEHTHTSAKYEKFVYSNRFGFSVPRAEWGLAQGAFDSMLALSERDRIYRVKRFVEEASIDRNVLYSRWKPWPDVEVRTWLVAGAPWHIRVHCIQSERALDAADGGFAIGIEDAAGKRRLKELRTSSMASAETAWGVSGIAALYGGGQPEIVHPNANTNILHARTVIPTATFSLEPGVHWLATGVYGRPAEETDGQQKQLEAAPRAEADGNLLRIFSGDGREILRFDRITMAILQSKG